LTPLKRSTLWTLLPSLLEIAGPEGYEDAFELTNAAGTMTMVPIEVTRLRFQLQILGE
jgi:hypothetical protein